ncbi:hypothetical protein AAFF_G00078930 [Aldrovandia affinis]|uniref:Uncharacterized protein n=1 Tax=Aldrovandia affinis TaxID=143900 RepID=A0AAD7RXE7_9TELE|nr:hypothetical protein AAFF_G00078930 [Aldrovandia affinis]
MTDEASSCVRPGAGRLKRSDHFNRWTATGARPLKLTQRLSAEGRRSAGPGLANGGEKTQLGEAKATLKGAFSTPCRAAAGFICCFDRAGIQTSLHLRTLCHHPPAPFHIPLYLEIRNKDESLTEIHSNSR